MSRSVTIEYRSSNNTRYVDEFPSQCGLCHKNIDPKYISGSFIQGTNESSREVQLVFQCTNTNCNSLIIGYYDQIEGKTFKLTKSAPNIPVESVFAKEIKEVSKNFVKIYNQAFHAEQTELDLISGIGYRKALEFLVKDYLIYIDSENEQEILTKPLGQCINMLDNHNIKEIAKRATWIGNDEAHYIRKWEDKDINDLKKLIEVAVYYITMEVTSEKYLE